MRHLKTCGFVEHFDIQDGGYNGYNNKQHSRCNTCHYESSLAAAAASYV
jgi:hypothetical protein